MCGPARVMVIFIIKFVAFVPLPFRSLALPRPRLSPLALLESAISVMSASSSRRSLSALATISLSAWSIGTVAAVQPTKKGTANTFEIVGTSGVSAQQVPPVVAGVFPDR